MRLFFYFFLGLTPTLCFSSRFFIQWITSERAGKSVIPHIFWILSLVGNTLAALHYFVQMQLPFLLIQSANGFIAARHLALSKKQGGPFWIAATRLVVLLLALSGLHFLHLWANNAQVPLFGAPAIFLSKNSQLSLFWVLLGALGSLIFGLRFWAQWWRYEKKHEEGFSHLFLYMSLIGSLLCFFYFMKLGDSVSSINTGLGTLPYLRNLFLKRYVLKKA